MRDEDVEKREHRDMGEKGNNRVKDRETNTERETLIQTDIVKDKLWQGQTLRRIDTEE